MKFGSLMPRAAIALGLAIGLTGTSAMAQVVTGKKNLVCASQDVMACIDGPVCMQGNTNTFDLPAFMFINVKNKDIRAVDEDGSEVVTPVMTHEVTEESVIMQGFENHRGWTMAVDRADGSFTLSATGRDVNFMVMGACTAL